MRAIPYFVAPAVPQESEELARLINSAYRGESSFDGWTTEAEFLEGQRTDPLMLEEMIRTPRTYLLTYRETRNGPILGCVHLHLQTPEVCHLGMLTISPKLQAKGLGKTLLAEAERFAKEKGAERIRMNVIHLRESLIAWYERRGYRRTGEESPFPYDNERVGAPLRQDLKFLVFEKKF